MLKRLVLAVRLAVIGWGSPIAGVCVAVHMCRVRLTFEKGR